MTTTHQSRTYSTKTSPFLKQVRTVLRLKHMSHRTEASYLHCIVDYIHFHGQRHPREMGVQKIRTINSLRSQRPLRLIFKNGSHSV